MKQTLKTGLAVIVTISAIITSCKKTETEEVQRLIVQCNWKTSMELNNNAFTVERSKDGINFLEIGTIPGGGSTVNATYYQYIDDTAFGGLSYYRLKQTDFDGNTVNHSIVSVFVDGEESITLM